MNKETFIKAYRTVTKRELFTMVKNLLRKNEPNIEPYSEIYNWSKMMKKAQADRDKPHKLKDGIHKYPLTLDQVTDKPWSAIISRE